MKLLPLTSGDFTVVNDDIYEWASKTKWCWDSNAGVRNTKSGKQLHRLIMRASKGTMVDHFDHDRKNNQRVNLRVCTSSQNHQNQVVQTLHKGKAKSSKYKGVYRAGKKWKIQIGFGRKLIYLGYSILEAEAALIYNKAALLYFGEFAYLNKIGEEQS